MTNHIKPLKYNIWNCFTAPHSQNFLKKSVWETYFFSCCKEIVHKSLKFFNEVPGKESCTQTSTVTITFKTEALSHHKPNWCWQGFPGKYGLGTFQIWNGMLKGGISSAVKPHLLDWIRTRLEQLLYVWINLLSRGEVKKFSKPDRLKRRLKL